MSSEQPTRNRVGVVRPSQLMYTYGIGSTIDLTNFSVIVKGLDYWDNSKQQEITEPRLLSSLHELNLADHSVRQLFHAPWEAEGTTSSSRYGLVGIPVATFPRWFRCSNPSCNYLGKVDSDLIKFERNFNDLTKNRYVHDCPGSKRPFTALPSRFVIACSNGHLDEFPWVEFCHIKTSICDYPRLTLSDLGGADRSTSLIVKCTNCSAGRGVASAFGQNGRDIMPKCRGRHPHLGNFTEDCTVKVSPILMGASNLWFAVNHSAISIPAGVTELDQIVSDNIEVLSMVDDAKTLSIILKARPDLRPLSNFSPEEVLAAIQGKLNSSDEADVDLYTPEWRTMSMGGKAPKNNNFRCQEEPSPNSEYFESTILVKRLRAVTAFVGFTRVEAFDSDLTAETNWKDRVVRIASTPTPWLPANEHHGEGILIRFKGEKITKWQQRALDRGAQFQEGLDEWLGRRNVAPRPWPGLRFMLLHTFSHMLINALALECGYSAASLKERIYSNDGTNGKEAMAGVLIYTAANDSEGTLGGLIEQGRRDRLEYVIDSALESARLCSSDPLCIHHEPGTDLNPLNGSACHSCLLLPETSCSNGNRYLDRAILTDNLLGNSISFFVNG